jgi:hypothetical protein
MRAVAPRQRHAADQRAAVEEPDRDVDRVARPLQRRALDLPGQHALELGARADVPVEVAHDVRVAVDRDQLVQVAALERPQPQPLRLDREQPPQHRGDASR